jgi:hypothetical protein
MKKALILIGWMVGVLILAAWFDQAYASSERGTIFHLSTLMWSKVIFTLILATTVVGLAWFGLLRGERNKVVATIFLAIGLLALFSSTLYGSNFLEDIIADRNTETMLQVISSSGLALTPVAGAFIAVIGWVGLTTFGQRPLTELSPSESSNDTSGRDSTL